MIQSKVLLKMRSKRNYKDIEDDQGKVKFSVLKKKGKHKRAEKRIHSK